MRCRSWILCLYFAFATAMAQDNAFEQVFGKKLPAPRTVAKIDLSKMDVGQGLPPVHCFPQATRGFMPPIWTVTLHSIAWNSTAGASRLIYTLYVENNGVVPQKVPFGVSPKMSDGYHFEVLEIVLNVSKQGNVSFKLPNPVRLYRDFLNPDTALTLQPGEKIEITADTEFPTEKLKSTSSEESFQVSPKVALLSPGSPDPREHSRESCILVRLETNIGVGTVYLSTKAQ